MNIVDKVERVQFLKRNIGDWSEDDADDVCVIALDALRASTSQAEAQAPTTAAPALAPTIPTEDMLVTVIWGTRVDIADYWVKPGQSGEICRGSAELLARKILALIAKGDTP